MTGLPTMLRRLPYVFYGLAAVFFVWRLGNEWVALTQNFQYADNSSVTALAKAQALFAAFTDAVYMVSNGALLQVLIAIFDKVKGQ